VKVYEEILQHSYSVRKVEEIVKALNEGETIKSGKKTLATKGNKLPEEFNILKKHLSGFFNAKVQLSCTAKGKGKLVYRLIMKRTLKESWKSLIV
jgi:chromosome segregation DNA-binding protein